MNAPLKTAVESALVALLVAACCLWFLISSAHLEDPPAARLALLAIGLGCALVVHMVFMAMAVKRSGRSVLLWMFAIVVLVPLGTAAFMAVLAMDDKQQQQP